jgi:replicative DNA helicase
VLVEGQLAIIGGPTKSLKTLVALDMAISIATGSSFLGRSLWACDRPRKVGFFSGESGAGTLLAKFHVICGAKQSQLDPPLPAEIRDGVEAHAAANIIWNDALPDLGSMASLRQLQRAIRQQQLDVLFLDPLFLCMGSAGKDMANAALVGQTLMNANRAVTDEGCTLILVHHPSGDKLRRTSAQARDPLELTDLAYPGVTNFCRQWLTINRAAPYEHETRRSELWLNIGGSGLQAGGIYRAAITEGFVHNLWQVRVQTQSECIERERVVRDVERRRDERDRRSRVRRYLLAHPDGVSVRHMTRNQGELAGIGQSGIEQALRDLQGDHGLRVWSEDVGNGVRWFVREIPDPRQWPQRDEGEVAGQG